MHNPWLDIPLGDYEGHMNSPSVGQLEVLAELFGQALAYCRPESVAILGIAGGNGLEKIAASVTPRIVCVDIQPAYLEEVRERHRELPLTLICADLERETLREEPVQLVHAALIFEHAGTEGCLRNVVSLVAANGFLSVVLQLPSEATAGVSPTPYPSIQKLGGHFRFVDVKELGARLSSLGYRLVLEERRALPAGKGFWLGIFAAGPQADQR